MVCVHELRPEVAAQEDTSVLREHRGHRLGLRQKLEMIDWLHAERPDVAATDAARKPAVHPGSILRSLSSAVHADTLQL